MDRDHVKANFLNTVKDHSLEIVHNDGVHRHLVFSKNKSMVYQFHLTTWPGHLCISGDMGTYVFSRIEDMFDFFRDSEDLRINPGYWGEKLQAICKTGGFMEWSEEFFQDAIKSDFDAYFGDEDVAPDDEDEQEFLSNKADCWEQIEIEVLHSPEDEHASMEAAMNFGFNGFQFQDFWEHQLRDYTYHYLWCLYAIVWGIQQFDLIANERTEA